MPEPTKFEAPYGICHRCNRCIHRVSVLIERPSSPQDMPTLDVCACGVLVRPTTGLGFSAATFLDAVAVEALSAAIEDVTKEPTVTVEQKKSWVTEVTGRTSTFSTHIEAPPEADPALVAALEEALEPKSKRRPGWLKEVIDQAAATVAEWPDWKLSDDLRESRLIDQAVEEFNRPKTPKTASKTEPPPFEESSSGGVSRSVSSPRNNTGKDMGAQQAEAKSPADTKSAKRTAPPHPSDQADIETRRTRRRRVLEPMTEAERAAFKPATDSEIAEALAKGKAAAEKARKSRPATVIPTRRYRK